MGEIKTGDVVVAIVRDKPRLARFVERTPGGKLLVRDGVKSDGEERLVEKVIALVEQPA